ncbi:hypothetical protein Misp01_71540 [Microtetraspora sp. NBRC 13810]|uniref:hypothetical protein n=1 Tax=Microtetraspora sp. NBRC 13810 TaxID=3030990 RepID=UPI0024A3CE3D|nr:hypothetical protein [Microtetraspora sp. NBRC 13810]GLW12026.1 hypothetical protein Misp01_71540 [Microtetraspora sp. NBRC 13810]
MSLGKPNTVLAAKLHTLFVEICAQSNQLRNLSDQQAANEVAGWPVVQEINKAAAEIAQQNDYFQRSWTRYQREGSGRQTVVHWGRSIDETSLHSLGIVRALCTQKSIPSVLIDEITAFLAGPKIPIQRHVVIDADIDLSEPLEVAGWRLWRPTRKDLEPIRPLPSVALYAASTEWDPLLYDGSCSMLSRIDENASPRESNNLFPAFLMDELLGPELNIVAWQPLLLLNLFSDDPVNIASEYEVEAQRYMEMIKGGRLTTTPIGNPDDEYEVVSFGPFWASGEKLIRLLRFLRLLSDHLATWPPRGKVNNPKSHPFYRLQQSAQRLLSLNPYIGQDGDIVFQRRSGEILLWCVAALEHLMTAPREKDGDLTRRVTQRAAILVGHDDNDRLQTKELVRKAYAIRSIIAHGGNPGDDHATATLASEMRKILRKSIIRRIILGPDIDIAASCDNALLSTHERESVIEAPIKRFRILLEDGPAPTQ